MSLDKSLKGTNKLGGKRNVLNRIERIKILKEKGLWTIGDKVTGLPKIKVIKLKKIKVEKKEKEEETKWDDIRK